MSSRSPLVFKIASEDWEFEQIHRLNYRTFVEEIPQHQASPTHRLVDKFHAENTYLICLSGNQLVGMLAARGNRPFSLDQKLPDLDALLPGRRKICEIRLLAVEKKFRGHQVLQGILALLWQHGVEQGYELAIISGTTRQFKLYQHLGFVPFGPLVGTGDAQFQPMYITLETFEKTARDFLRASPARSFQPSAMNFLPGPVAIRREVRRAFEQAPESHRSVPFAQDFAATRKLLCDLTMAGNVELVLGSGTLANDLVGAQLSLLGQPGLVLSNGEFGERLLDHARRWKLEHSALQYAWGRTLNLSEVREKMVATGARWVWLAHCETSTGILNPLGEIQELCQELQVRLCSDCISSIGTVPVDLSRAYLASCASGKGLRSYPGVCMVFHNHEVLAAPDLPRYLDLGYYAANGGVPFTFSSNLLHALHAAIKRVNWEGRFQELRVLSGWLRPRLTELGFNLIGDVDCVSPVAITIALPAAVSSVEFARELAEAGYLLSYNSEYLRRRNWIQICMMGECTSEKVVSLLNALQRAIHHHGGSFKTIEDGAEAIAAPGEG
jgi:aspartate aminotransferase-like enzyme